MKKKKYILNHETVKTVLRLYYKEKLNVFEIKEYFKKTLDEKISLSDISKILTSVLANIYKEVNKEYDYDYKKGRAREKDVKIKDRESNKDIFGVD